MLDSSYKTERQSQSDANLNVSFHKCFKPITFKGNSTYFET